MLPLLLQNYIIASPFEVSQGEYQDCSSYHYATNLGHKDQTTRGLDLRIYLIVQKEAWPWVSSLAIQIESRNWSTM